VVGLFGFVQYQHREAAVAPMAAKLAESLDKEAKNVVPAAPAPATAQVNQQAATSEKQAAPPAERSDREASNRDRADAANVVAAPSSTEALVRKQGAPKPLQHGPHVQYQQNANNYQSQAIAAPAPPAPARVGAGQADDALVSAQAPSANTPLAPGAENELAKLDSGAAALQSQPDLRQPNSRVERSKPIATTAKAQASPAARAMVAPLETANSAQFVSVNRANSIMWRIDSGTLQRSADQGTTWQQVDMNGAIGSASAAIHGSEKNALSDSLKKEASATIFRAVISNGSDVWVGASGGLLYHSIDAGWHWTRVVPSSSGAHLTGDILSLEFPDPQHGRVVTTAPEVWITDDGGQTWLKQ
jgi:hypothetical protein